MWGAGRSFQRLMLEGYGHVEGGSHDRVSGGVQRRAARWGFQAARVWVRQAPQAVGSAGLGTASEAAHLRASSCLLSHGACHPVWHLVESRSGSGRSSRRSEALPACVLRACRPVDPKTESAGIGFHWNYFPNGQQGCGCLVEPLYGTSTCYTEMLQGLAPPRKVASVYGVQGAWMHTTYYACKDDLQAVLTYIHLPSAACKRSSQTAGAGPTPQPAFY